MKPRFCTLFPRTENFHLVKDVGMVPFILHKYYGYQSIVATYQNSKSYPYLENEVKGLKIDFIPQKFQRRNLNLALYILKNFRKIDILQMYHFEIDQLDILGLYIILRKLFFMKSFTYVKCDGSSRFTDTDFQKIKFKFFRKWVIKKINIFSVETSLDYKIIKQISDYQEINLKLIPNGFYDEEKKYDISQPKEKVILTVGRLGTHQKNTEFLLDAFQDFAREDKDWKLILVGSIEDHFKFAIKDFYKKNPELEGRVIFTDSVTDRERLKSYYKQSSVFILTSRGEGSPLVVPEAISTGCFVLLSSKINLKDDVINNGEFGRYFSIDDKSELVSIFRSLNEINFETKKLEIQEFAYHQFYWPQVVSIIDSHYKSTH